MPTLKHEDYVLSLERYLSDVFPKLVSYQPHPSSYSPLGDFHAWLGGIPQYVATFPSTWQVSEAMEEKLNILLSPHYKNVDRSLLHKPPKESKCW
jgi:hypothetical protein